MQKYLDDQYLFLMVAVIVTPVLIVLIVQVAAFPLKLHQYEIVNEVMISSSMHVCLMQS